MKLYYKKIKKQQSKYQVRWITDLRYRLLIWGGAFGGVGGAGGQGAAAAATTRLNVVDPHIVQMMRDVMSPSDAAARLRPCAGAGGGGGGGGAGVAEEDGDGDDGQDGIPVIAPYGAINSGTSSAGGAGGQGGNDAIEETAYVGSGGGGGGGQGGVIVVITTTAEASIGTLDTNIYVTSGSFGEAGPVSGYPAGEGDDAPPNADNGKYIPIVV